ncbi:MAG: glycosyltransferase family 2 protein [Prolixibacteraceae bacterium]|jgi:hypothetical protein|nr:glycosyltransferase family 2 protein [Prolixibacteraceae bacterium]
MFANRYLQKSHNSEWIENPPDPDTGIIVVIPCYREPEIIKTLESLRLCDLPSFTTEVIVLINHSVSSNEEVIIFNHNTASELSYWIRQNNVRNLRFFAEGPVEFPSKWAGAGLARKRGMDNAVRRFNLLNRPEGIILSLDADTVVDKNYLTSVYEHFVLHPSDPGAVISFKHQTEGLKGRHLQGILLYEKYISYYRNALLYTGYPYPIFTVGSAFAVRADAYIKRGGMNRRQAGEDFYFLQNLVQLGNVGEISSTTVHPSARLSDRVPFGTGPILSKWMCGEEDLTKTYNFMAFMDLRAFFMIRKDLFRISEAQYYKNISYLPEPIQDFLLRDIFLKELDDLNRNCSSLKTFNSRFFQKFNAFKILKYLNYVHNNYYEKEGLEAQIGMLESNLQ